MNSIINIWDDFNQELKGFIFNKTKNQADTEDILQDVFLKITRNLDKVNQADNLRPYLFAIVRNTVNDYFRNQKNGPEETDIPDQLPEEELQSLNSTIAECCLKPFINKLPDHYKEALLMTEFQQFSQKELAQKLNISYSGAKSRVQRGKEKLKELILTCCNYSSDRYGNLQTPESKNCHCS